MDVMDVAGLSMDLSSTRVINNVQVAVLKKSLDTLESNGDGLTLSLIHISEPKRH